jgi:hypothetical protein
MEVENQVFSELLSAKRRSFNFQFLFSIFQLPFSGF